jgi:2-alkyl-3-oxoalkanoate reductase
MKVLVTGGRGLLGTATARTLVSAGHDVTLFQRGRAEIDLPHVLGDIQDRAAIMAAVRGYDAVVHMAARVSTVGRWSDFESVNVQGTRHALQAAQHHGVSRFVYVSSPSVAHVGDALVGMAASPASPDRARSHYSRSKAMAEREVLAQRDLAAVAIRPHLVWGPGDTQLIGRIVDRARQGRLVLIGHGTALIDTTYVDNAATAICAALERVADPGVRGRAFVVSNGEPRTVAELFTRITRAAGVSAPTRSVPPALAIAGGTVIENLWRFGTRVEEPPMSRFLAEQLSTAHWFAQEQTRTALGWAPSVGLDEGFSRLKLWFDGVATGD